MFRRKDGRWVETLTVNGKRKYIYGNTKKEVQEKIRKIEEIETVGLKFQEVLEEWQEEHFPSLVPSTRSGYMSSVKRAAERFGDEYIKEIQPADIQSFLKEIARKGYSKKVVSTQLNVLNMTFDYGVYNGYIKTNPCQSIKVPRGLPKKKREIPTRSDIDIINESDWLFPYFLLYTGCRRGEALAVTYEDIDFERKTITINKAIGFEHNAPYIKQTKTDAGTRVIPLLDNLADRLPRNKKGLVFSADGKPYRETRFRRRWEAWQKQYGINITCHQLRHMYATILYDAQIDAKDAQALMGHSSISMTLDVYTHIRESRIASSANKLNEFVSKGI
jgi:integrase